MNGANFLNNASFLDTAATAHINGNRRRSLPKYEVFSPAGTSEGNSCFGNYSNLPCLASECLETQGTLSWWFLREGNFKHVCPLSTRKKFGFLFDRTTRF